MFISEGETQREFKLVPDGSHLAICYGIVDLGTQGYVYMNEKKSAKQLRLLWELHGEDQDGNALSLDDGRPLSISQRYTQSLGDKSNLRKIIVSWRGGKDLTPEELGQVRGQRGWDIKTLIGKHCMLTVKHSIKGDRTFANVDAVTAVPAVIKKLGLPDMVNAPIYFSFDRYSESDFESVSAGLKRVIMQSPEYEMRANRSSRPVINKPTSLAEVDDDIPF